MKRHHALAFVALTLGLIAAITFARPPAGLKAGGTAPEETGATSSRGIICEPSPDAQSCAIIDCPDGVSKCRPRCVKMLATGEIEIVDCDCRSGEECYVLWAAGTPPFCNTFCPPGEVCERTEFLDPFTGDLTVCCDCRPTTECGPESDGLSCRAVECEDPTEQCIPKCIVINQGVITIEACECQTPDECHVSWVPGTPPECVGGCPPGMVCEQQVTTTPTGATRICCECVPDVSPVCEPAPDGESCNPIECPDPAHQCLPKCILNGNDGVISVVDCECRSPNECHMQWVPGTPPDCVGGCPPGEICDRTVTLTPDGKLICCECIPVPQECAPTPDGQACEPFECPDPSHQCTPKCVFIDADGQITVDECDCRSPNECHVTWFPGAPPQCEAGCPPGYICVQDVVTTPEGTRICCDCVPDEPVECEPTPDGQACEPVVCPNPGELCRPRCIKMLPTGQFEIIDCECRTEDECYLEWQPGADPQCLGGCPPGEVCERTETFDPATGELIICCDCRPETGECAPTPDGLDCEGDCPKGSFFDICRPTQAIENPATGEVTFTKCGCDCWLRRNDTPPFEFIGCAGEVCDETGEPCQMVVTQNADGTITYDCCAEPPPVECEPEEDGLSCKQVLCPEPNDRCMPKCVLIGLDGTITIDECECRSPDECHVDWQPGADPQCIGGCPPGYVCEQQVFTTPEGTLICCECVIDPPACEPTDDRQDCKPFICPNPEEECRPRCVRHYPQTGVTEVLDCECRGPEECGVQVAAGAAPFCEGACPPGEFCTRNVFQNADGSVDICCDCVSPECDCPGDINGDGVLNGLDIAGFVRCLLGNPQPGDNCTCADIDGDGLLTLLDIPLFIELVLSKVKCGETECCPKEDLILDLATGVDADGNLIPVGSDDDDWIVTVDASGGTTPRPATVVAPHPFWLTIPGTQWISADYFGPNGDYAYDFCFCLDDRFKLPTLTVQLRADDDCAVYLNGNFLGFGAGFNAGTPALITTSNPAFFKPGENCLRVEVQNIGGPPTGLNLAGTVRARDGACCCPPEDLDKNIDSGVEDSTGNLIPFGQDDDTWVVTVDASGGSVPRPATVITPHPAWLTIPGTRWISAAQTGPNGDYVYEHCFCLDPRFKNAALSLDLRADDYATVWLNGVQVGATPTSYSFNTPTPTHVFVTNQALFRPCENCIEIVVTNSHGVVTGVNVAATITAEDGLCCDDHPQQELSCCLPDGNCVDLAPGVTECPVGGTLVLGPCETPQPCCMADGSCIDTDPRCCQLAGGTTLTGAADCQTAPEACCFEEQGVLQCLDVNPACCIQRYGGTPQGPGTVCLGDNNGNGIDDACEEPVKDCRPDPAAPTRCLPVPCPNPDEQCQPKCVRIEGDMVLEVLDCECMSPDECRVTWDLATGLNPRCVGGCPPGETCVPEVFTNPDGTQTFCCRCEPKQGELCPVPTTYSGQFCVPLQQQQCTFPMSGQLCVPLVVMSHGQGNFDVVQCHCWNQGECGPIDIQQDATGHILSCPPGCPPGAACVIHIDGVPTTSNNIYAHDVPAGSLVTCNCYIP